MKNPERRIRLSSLIKKKRESLKLTQQDFCNWIVEKTGIDDLTYGALQAWEDPKRKGNLPSCDNFYALSIVFETTMDDLYRYLCGNTEAPPQVIDQDFEQEKLKSKIKSMPISFQKDLMLSIQSDLLGATD
jgi:transcriptional regulator with XRE-family HTH domain